MGTFFKQRKDKAGKRKGWAQHFTSCILDTVDHKRPLPIQLLGFRKPLPLVLSVFKLFLFFRGDIAQWLPGMACFVCMIYSGSKALAKLVSKEKFIKKNTIKTGITVR